MKSLKKREDSSESSGSDSSEDGCCDPACGATEACFEGNTTCVPINGKCLSLTLSLLKFNILGSPKLCSG